MSKANCDEHRIRTHAQSLRVLPPELFEQIRNLLRREYRNLIAVYFTQKYKYGWIRIRFKSRIPGIIVCSGNQSQTKNFNHFFIHLFVISQ